MKKLLFLALLFLFIQCGTEKPNKQKPNIIVFLVDDMGWQETSVPFHIEKTSLNERFHTPNMERLAEKGMLFTQAYASALCSPSRVSLITGTNPVQHGVTCWTLRRNKSPEGMNRILDKANWNLNGLSPEPGIDRSFYFPQILPKLLKQAGYHTIHAGKAHFGAKDTPGENPLNIGFDVNIAGHAAGGPGSYHGDKNFSAVWRRGSDIWDVPGLEKYHGQKINLTEALTIEANAAMEAAVQEGKPFFLHMSHYTVHAPWEADRRFVKKYVDSGLNKTLANHASMIESMDKSLGDIMDKVKALGIERNTIFVFISDNGAPSQMTPNLPLRGHKLTAYEGGTRIPMMVKWPGITTETKRNNHPVIIQDIYASVLEWAGLSELQPKLTDSHSFLPLVKGETVSSDRRFIWHYPNLYDQPPYSSIRLGDWKLIYFYTDQHHELYNLKEDIGEINNLAKEKPEKVQNLAASLGDYLRNAKAERPILKSTGEPVPWPDGYLDEN
ncbi:MAG: sulfatase [Cytophagales bacterium]|nr:sulfatase [Cytophagales bacterium]